MSQEQALAPQQNGQQEGRLANIAVAPNVGAQITNMGDAWAMAQAFVKAQMVPRSFDNAYQVMLALMAGAEIGLGTTASLKYMMVVNGTPSLWGDAPMAVCLRSGKVEWHQSGFTGEPFKDDYTAWYEVKRRDVEGSALRTFSVADAKQAGLWNKKGPWQNHPKRMLFVRARAFALRDLFPDVLGGLGIYEEQIEAVEEASEHESRSDAMRAQLEEAQKAVPVEAAEETGGLFDEEAAQ